MKIYELIQKLAQFDGDQAIVFKADFNYSKGELDIEEVLDFDGIRHFKDKCEVVIDLTC